MNALDSRQFLVTTWTRAVENLTRSTGRPCLIGQMKPVTTLTYDYPKEHRSIVPDAEHKRFNLRGLTDRVVEFSAEPSSHGRITFRSKSAPLADRTFRFRFGAEPEAVARVIEAYIADGTAPEFPEQMLVSENRDTL